MKVRRLCAQSDPRLLTHHVHGSHSLLEKVCLFYPAYTLKCLTDACRSRMSDVSSGAGGGTLLHYVPYWANVEAFDKVFTAERGQ